MVKNQHNVKYLPDMRRKSSAHRLYLSLKSDLAQGVYAPKQQLPTLADLCLKHDVSINTARKAVNMLVREGCLISRPRIGTYVRDSQAEAAEAGKTMDVVSIMCHFPAEELMKLQQHALKQGVMLCTIPSQVDHYNPKLERELLENMLKNRHRGVLANCTPTQPGNLDLIDAMLLAGIRVTHINYYSRELPRQSYILPDYRKAGYVAASHLMMGGYKRLVFATHKCEWPAVSIFRQGCLDAIKEYRGGCDEREFVFSRVGTFLEFDATATEEFKALLTQSKESIGVIAIRTGWGRRILEVAAECGLSVPRDVGVVSTTYPELLEPSPVDYIHFDHIGMVKSAIDAVMAESWRSPQQLVAGTLVKAGTVRNA